MPLFTPARLVLLVFTLGYTFAGAFYLFRHGNTEFLTYLVALTPLLFLGFWLNIRYNVPLWMLWLISILFALHLAGGTVMVGGSVLYDYVIVPIPNWTGLTLWKYDQFVHPYGAASLALISYALMARSVRLPHFVLFLLAFMVANGAGALNEVAEFATKIATPDTGVGGYYNTALDLFFNMLGAAGGALLGRLLIRRNLDSKPVSS
jgi:uncharacterized membrane protein YjdF